MDFGLAGIAFAVVALTAVLLVTGMVMRHRRRGPARAMLVTAGALVVVLVLGATPFIKSALEDRRIAMTSMYGTEFILDIPHTRASMNEEEYRFRPRASDAEVLQKLTSQHPAGVLNGDHFTVVSNGVRFTIEPDPEDGVWIATRHTVSVTDMAEVGYIISFPTEALHKDTLPFGIAMPLQIDRQLVYDELALLGTPVAEDDTVLVPTLDQSFLRISFTDRAVTFDRI